MTDKQIPNERRQYEYKSVFTNTDKQTQEYCPFNVNKDYCHINDTGDYIIPFCKKEKCKFLKWYKSVEDRLWRLSNDR